MRVYNDPSLRTHERTPDSKPLNGEKMLLRFAFIILLVVGCIARLCAQAGQEQITVHVTYEDDRTTPANLRVELLSAFGSIIETTITDGVGAVVFRHLQPAKYKLRVTGEGAV